MSPKTSEAEARKAMRPRQTIGTPSSVAPLIEEVRSRKSQGIARLEEERLKAPVEASTPGSEQESHKGSFQLRRTPQEKKIGRGTTRVTLNRQAVCRTQKPRHANGEDNVGA